MYKCVSAWTYFLRGLLEARVNLNAAQCTRQVKFRNVKIEERSSVMLIFLNVIPVFTFLPCECTELHGDFICNHKAFKSSAKHYFGSQSPVNNVDDF